MGSLVPVDGDPFAASHKPKGRLVPVDRDPFAGSTNWSSVNQQSLENVDTSLVKSGKDIYQAIRHPIQTAKGMYDIGKGALQHMGALDPGPEMEAASAAKKHYVDRYGGLENIKKTLATDPIGALLDASVVAMSLRAPFAASKAARISKAAPAVEKLEKAAKAKYDETKRSGARWTADEYDDLVSNITLKIHDKGADPVNTPGSVRVAKRMFNNMGHEMTVRDLQTLRRQAQGVQKKTDNEHDAELGRIIKEEIDATIEDKVPAFREANRLWYRAKSGKRIENLIEAGEMTGKSIMTGSGAEAGIRTQFRQVAKPTEEGDFRLRKYTPEVQAAIKKTATGTRAQRAARYIGKLAPTGVVPGMGGGALAYGLSSFMGPMAYPIVFGVGGGARRIATRGTRNNAARASALARTGGKLPRVGPGAGKQAAGLLGLLQAGEHERYRRGLLAPR